MLSGTVPLFFATSGMSAFLLFLVQPLVGKTLLPLYGGSASVWTTCLLFFQTVLLAGYGYAHVLTRLVPPKKQIWHHGVVLVIAVLLSRILPEGTPAVSTNIPVAMLLYTLLKHVGLPFFALSATAPLLQHWFHLRFPERSPYPLYAVSNAGSFAAVLAYPFLVERFFPLNTQEYLWSIGFGVFAVACMASGWAMRGGARAKNENLYPEVVRPEGNPRAVEIIDSRYPSTPVAPIAKTRHFDILAHLLGEPWSC